MGYIAAKDTGSVGIVVEDSLYVGSPAGPDGVFNPSSEDVYPDKYGVVSLKAFSLNFNTGKNIDSEANIAGQCTRLGMGSTKPIPFKLSASYSRKLDGNNRAATELRASTLRALPYIFQWSRARTVIMLMFIPNSNKDTWLSKGQEIDFFTSQLQTIYDVIWDKNTDSSTRGFQSSTYGTNHYRIPMTSEVGEIGNYDCCAVPCIIEDFDVKEPADSNKVTVSITGYFLENEIRQ